MKRRASRKLQTRVDSRGYTEYWDPRTATWQKTHRRVAEKKWGEVPTGKHVHHINGDKLDNSYRNLAHVTPAIHRKLHANKEDAGNTCFHCGRVGHWASGCKYKTDYRGKRIKD